MNLDMTMRESSSTHGETSENDLELLLQSKYNYIIIDKDRDLNINRSGSAPPTVEGSLTAVETLLLANPLSPVENYYKNDTNTQLILSEEEIRSHPAYLSYYYSSENLNPRLLPPLLSREHWRMAQRFNQGGGDTWQSWAPTAQEEIASGLDGDLDGSSSLFSVQPMLSPSVNEAVDDRELMGFRDLIGNKDGSIGVSGGVAGLGMRRKSFADILQEGLERPTTRPSRLSRPSSHTCLSNMVDETGTTYTQCTEDSHNDVPMPRVLSFGSLLSDSILSARATTPRIPTAIKKVTSVDNMENIARMNSLNRALSSSMNNLADIAASISLLSQSINQVKKDDTQELHQHKVRFDDDANTVLGFNSPLVKSSPSYRTKAPPGFTSLKESNISCQSGAFSSFGTPFEKPNNCSVDKKPEISDYLDRGGLDGALRISTPNVCSKTPPGFTSLKRSSMPCQADTVSGMSSIVEMPSHSSVDKKLDSSNCLDIRGSDIVHSRNGENLNMPHYNHSLTSPRNSTKGSNKNSQQTLKTSQPETLLAHTKNQYNAHLKKSTVQFHLPCYPNPDFGLNITYKGNTNTVMANGRNSCFNTIPFRANADVVTSRLLEELKSNKPKPLELLDVVDNVFAFSKDQYGSRFIQQKLETATAEEKTKIFPEILSHCRALSVDVFGNYVIQKFFEHGTDIQRKELAKQLVGHVLPFSFQMYGCRVIQKALEVVDIEQQTMLVSELDGSVMKCVCDQNGNHVIQKCIQFVPQEKIQFIIESFYGQIAALSKHPYGCRVVQRVLENCDDPNVQKVIVGEIIHSACILAQDQYGNYVVQHVIQDGKVHERSAIIRKLAGQIVKMSKQKFASNVVEKCLIFGGPEDRQLIVKEMLGTTDKNEPLQAMTKDPFGNYVVQKVLETCDGPDCELIVSRLKLHLSTLKRYTYGKHIVSRVEKLIAAGEGRGGIVSS